MPLVTRRTFLIAAAALAPAAGTAARQAGGSILHEQFMQLSRWLVGNHQLDARTGAIYLDALLAVPDNGPRLRRFMGAAAIAAEPADIALQATIVEWWYTGVYTVRGERRVATHTGALMWAASGTVAPGSCASAFGAWSRPPRTV